MHQNKLRFSLIIAFSTHKDALHFALLNASKTLRFSLLKTSKCTWACTYQCIKKHSGLAFSVHQKALRFGLCSSKCTWACTSQCIKIHSGLHFSMHQNRFRLHFSMHQKALRFALLNTSNTLQFALLNASKSTLVWPSQCIKIHSGLLFSMHQNTLRFALLDIMHQNALRLHQNTIIC